MATKKYNQNFKPTWALIIFLLCVFYILYYTLSGMLTAVGNIFTVLTFPFTWLWSKLKEAVKPKK